MKWFIKCIKNYASFSGRARRKEYWMFVLFEFIFGCVANILDKIFNTIYHYSFEMDFGNIIQTYDYNIGYIASILSLFLLLPGLAVLVRRLHDLGKSGAWFFISFIPLIGLIWMLILMCTDGQRFDNQYGSDPKNTIQSDSFITE